ncbi:MAG: hypothetical protein M1827_003117 [Pycnora praestabilis]|nr:MAG: hypothetical protein M1827_003117 [Pycnora praestabilis]
MTSLPALPSSAPMSHAVTLQNLSWREVIFRQWQWHWLAYVILAWEVRRMVVILYHRSPQNIKIVGLPSIFGSWLSSFRYSVDAEKVIANAYDESKGKPFAIPQRDRYHVCVSTKNQIEELNNASIHQVSLKAAIFDVRAIIWLQKIESCKLTVLIVQRVFPEQTIDGLQFNDSDPNGSVSQNVFKYRLRSHLPMLRPSLQRKLEEALKVEIPVSSEKAWTRIPVQSVVNRLAGRMNNLIIVGEELSSVPEYFEAVMQYLHDATMTEELLQFVPTIFFPLVSSITMNWSGAQKKVVDFIHASILERVSNPTKDDQKPTDGIQWTIESSRNNTPRAIVRQVLAFVFGSAHQMPMLISFVLYNLCIHPEYIDPLREEIARKGNDEFTSQNEDMPLLDSFIKETARLNPPTIIGVPRKILSPFTFKDGTHIPTGNWACVPQQALMQDPANYPDSTTFNGFRFVNDKGVTKGSDSRFSHPSWLFTFWGSVKQACPARFYVSMAVKMIIIQFLTRYDFKLANENVPPAFAWGVARIPHPRLAMLVRERQQV